MWGGDEVEAEKWREEYAGYIGKVKEACDALYEKKPSVCRWGEASVEAS